MISSVLLKGGLGNQLFQFSYLHYFKRNSGDTIKFVSDVAARLDRPYELAELVGICSHGESAAGYKLGVNRENWSGFKFLFSRLLHRVFGSLNRSKMELHERTPYKFAKPRFADFVGGNKIIIGYFQNWKYPEVIWEQLFPEIQSILRLVESRNPNLSSMKNMTILHIRGGDFVSESETVGVLDHNYYLRALVGLGADERDLSNMLVLTDDLTHARKMLSLLGMPSLRLIDPEQMNGWEALFVMANSKNLICANSTLSWWGGFIAGKHGAQVIAPSPWNKDINIHSSSGLLHPKFTQLDSSFI